MEATLQKIIYYTKKSFLTAAIVQCRLSSKQATELRLRILFVIQIETAEMAAQQAEVELRSSLSETAFIYAKQRE